MRERSGKCGGSFVTTNGGNLSSLIGKSPAGTWNVKLNGLDTVLDNDKIADVIMVVTYEAETPPPRPRLAQRNEDADKKVRNEAVSVAVRL